MCHLIIRTLCRICHTQIGDVEIKPMASCLPPTWDMKPAWGSAAATLEQHRGKRVKRTTGLCKTCEARAGTPMTVKASTTATPASSESSGESGEGTPEKEGREKEVDDEDGF